MNIILFTKLGGRSVALRLDRMRVYLPLVFAAVAVCASLLQIGYRLGKQVEPINNASEAQITAAAPARGLAQAQINTLAQRIGLLGAQVQRLDALGRRLSQVAGINPDRFNLDAAPALGGPVAQLTAPPPSLSVVQSAFEQLAQVVDLRQQRLSVLDRFLWSHGFTQARFMFGEPAALAYVSSGFGSRIDPFTGLTDFHPGIDFAGRMGSPVVAAADGVVSWVGTREGYGHMVEIDHSNGLVTRYGHAQRTVVREGEIVSKGQTIALMGSSGRSTGPHVHFEVLQGGVAVDPSPYLAVLGTARRTAAR
ncbi:MAG: M23 family metallopeptidase [Gammaproteobacteria bacterium]